MCELYLSSAARPHFPAQDLAHLQRHGGSPWTNLQGWGAAWLEDDATRTRLLKHPQPARGAADYGGLLREAPLSPVWLTHLRAASTGGVSLHNTQPFCFGWPDHENEACAFMHNGELKGMDARIIEQFGEDPRDGGTDSEGAKIILHEALKAAEDIDAAWGVFGHVVQDLRAMGIANFIVALGADVFVHAHRRTQVGESVADDTALFMGQSEGRLRLSSEPFASDDTPVRRGQLLWIRDGAVRARGMTY